MLTRTTEQRKIFTQAAEHCKKKGSDIAKLAMQFSSQNPAIVTTMFSSANPDSVRRNVAWSNEPIDDELLKEVRDILLPVSNQNWKY